jgi:hypothetical protein
VLSLSGLTKGSGKDFQINGVRKMSETEGNGMMNEEEFFEVFFEVLESLCWGQGLGEFIFIARDRESDDPHVHTYIKMLRNVCKAKEMETVATLIMTALGQEPELLEAYVKLVEAFRTHGKEILSASIH